MPEAEAAKWLNEQFGTNIKVEAPAAPAKPLKIAFFVSDMTNVFHQGQFTEAKKYAKKSMVLKYMHLMANPMAQ
jgi:ABC-type sugar transport system substrate-binding protein